MAMKKIVALLLTALMLVSVFASCGKTESDEKVVKIGIFEPASGANGAGGKQETLGVKYAHSIARRLKSAGKRIRLNWFRSTISPQTTKRPLRRQN